MIERIQKLSLRVIYPDLSYRDALDHSDIKSLELRRDELCNKLFKSIIKDEHHKLYHLLPPEAQNTYNLRNVKPYYVPNYQTNRFRDTFIIFIIYFIISYTQQFKSIC